MAYFNDPLPCDTPALAAVQMALAARDDMRSLVADWQTRGYQLSYGIGIAYGYATLGMIGFEGRHDYSPLGSVVNLGARLCAHKPNPNRS
jgi:adenylate cyclase